MSKAAIRAEARALLRALPPAERAAAETEIARRVWDVPEVAAARTLLLYASLPEEVGTDEIAAEARRRGIALVYPRCLAPELRNLRFPHNVHRVPDYMGSGQEEKQQAGTEQDALHDPEHVGRHRALGIGEHRNEQTDDHREMILHPVTEFVQ